jgi:hypothetical protein
MYPPTRNTEFLFMCFVWFSVLTGIISLNGNNQLIIVIDTLCDSFAVQIILKYDLDELQL